MYKYGVANAEGKVIHEYMTKDRAELDCALSNLFRSGSPHTVVSLENEDKLRANSQKTSET